MQVFKESSIKHNIAKTGPNRYNNNYTNNNKLEHDCIQSFM